MNAVLQDWAKSVRNGTSPAAPPSKFLNERPSTTSVGGHGTVWFDRQPVAQQRRRGDHLEGRAGRIEAGQRAIERRVADGRLATASTLPVDGCSATSAALRPRVAERLLGGALDVEIERGLEVLRLAPRASAAVSSPRRRPATSRITTERVSRFRRAARRTAACRPHWPTSSPGASRPLDRSTCSAVAGPTAPSSARAKSLLGASGALPGGRRGARDRPATPRRRRRRRPCAA